MSTWGVDTSKLSDWERTEGFKYFRIVQVGTNFEGSYSLGLSALEVYGMTNDVRNWER